MNSHLFEQPPSLENSRLQLIPMQEKHATALFSISHPDIWRYMLSTIHTLDEMKYWVKQAIDLRTQYKGLPFVVLLKESGQIVGSTRLYNMDASNRACELGSTWYQPDFQRSFVNSDCKLLILQFCFETLGLIRVQLKTDERNRTSQKAMERMGATREGLLRNERILQTGYVRNAYVYSIIKEEWAEIKSNLIDKINRYQT